MSRQSRLERRLLGWSLALALGPALLVLGLATWIAVGSLGWLGTLGPWHELADSGRELFQAVETLETSDSALHAAADRHREELSGSMALASRWAFLGQRMLALLPVLALVFALALVGLALLGSRRLAKQLGRPITELVEWTERLGRGEPLPPEEEGRKGRVMEVETLRSALRQAADEVSASRRRALAAERIKVWGEMARRVAHEMKNPLTPLHLAAYRLEREPGLSDAARETLMVVREETGRLEELARRFAALGRPPEGPRSQVDMEELLQGLLASDVPADVTATMEVDKGVPGVEAHHETLVGVFRNLLRNALEAMEGATDKRLELTVTHSAGPEPQVQVRVADSGPGLPEGMEERVFEPDFTLRKQGTGLGLALVRQGVAVYGGEVHGHTRRSGGAEFVVSLPVKTHTGGYTSERPEVDPKESEEKGEV